MIKPCIDFRKEHNHYGGKTAQWYNVWWRSIRHWLFSESI